MTENCIKILQRQSNVNDMKDRAAITDFLSNVSYLRGICSKQELQDRLYDLAKYVEYEEIPEFDAVFHKGEQSQYLYFILKGNISVFIPKSSQDIELEVKWRQQLDTLNNEYNNLKQGSSSSFQSASQILNQINQGKSILKCLRNQEDEQLLKNKYFQKYFRSNGTICGFKKTSQLYEYDSFGESILSDQCQKRTATLIAHNGIPLRQINKQDNCQNEYMLEKSNNLREECNTNRKSSQQTNQKIQQVKERLIQQQIQQDIIEHQQSTNFSSANQIQTPQINSNPPFQLSNVIILAKISKKNYLKVFEQELEKRTFIRRALLNNFQKDLNQEILGSIAFFFKEEHLEKNQKVIKELENILPSSRKSLHSNTNNSASQNTEKSCSTERKRAQEILENPIFSHPDQEEEFLYLLYKGSIEIQKKMTQKSSIKNIESSLQNSTMQRISKVSLRLAQLSEGEFFGHENWFKEDFERMLNSIQQVSPSLAFQDKMIQIQKEFSIVVLETDTVIFKIPRKILCEFENQSLLKSLIIHGKQRNRRYKQLYKDAVFKQEESILQKIKVENEYFNTENNSQKQFNILTSQKAENLMKENKQPKNKEQSKNVFNDSQNDNSPYTIKELVQEFNTFKMKFDAAYNTVAYNTAVQPITKKQSYARMQSQIETKQDNFGESQNMNRSKLQNKSYHISSQSNQLIRQRSTLIFTSSNLNAIDSSAPKSLFSLETEEGEKPTSSQKKMELFVRINKRQRSMHETSESYFSKSQPQLILNKQLSKDSHINNFISSNYLDIPKEAKQGSIINRKQVVFSSHQISRNASQNSSPKNKQSFDQEIYELKPIQKNKVNALMQPDSNLIQAQQNARQFFQSNSQTQRNMENQDESQPQSPSIIKSLNLSPRKDQNNKNTYSIINLKKIQNDNEKTNNQQDSETFQKLEQNDNNFNDFTEICSKLNLLSQEKNNENQKNDNAELSPITKKVKFLLKVPQNDNNNNTSQSNQNFPLKFQNIDIKQKIKFLDTLKKKTPQFKNSFLNQINVKKQIFKNESIYKQLSEQQSNSISQFKQEISNKEQKPVKYLNGFLTTRYSDESLSLLNDFKTSSELINNINIDSKALTYRQNTQKTLSTQNSPKNQQKKTKTFSIHQISSTSLFQNTIQQQRSINSPPVKFNKSLQLKTDQQFQSPQLGGSQNERQFEVSQISPFISQEISLKQEIQCKNFKIFDDLSHRNSERVFDDYETKIHSGQDLDNNMISQDTAANSYDQLNIPLKPTQQFSQFKIQKQIIADVSKKSPSKQIIQNLFKKK